MAEESGIFRDQSACARVRLCLFSNDLRAKVAFYHGSLNFQQSIGEKITSDREFIAQIHRRLDGTLYTHARG